MAYADNTLNGLIQLNDKNLADIEVSNLLQDAPLMNSIFAKVASNGTQHKYIRDTVAAGAGFRAIGAGIANAAPQTELVTETLKLLDASFNRDIAIAKGFGKGPDAYMALEAMKSLRAAFFSLEKQVIYGTSNDAAGFSGLADTLDKLTDNMVVNAGGTSGGTVKTSVYAIRSGDEDLAIVAGNDGNIQLGDVFESVVLDGSNNPYHVLAMTVAAYYTLQMGSAYSAGRIANITNESGKSLTDGMISDLLAKFPSGKPATHIVMNRSARAMLQKSRTATNATGAPAPFPTEAFGVPIITTDAISSAESLATT